MTNTFDPTSDYLIISCDGGGIRGLIVSLVLQQINDDYPDFLGQTYLHAGTSTGGIISLALACNVSISDIVCLYQDQGGKIFTESRCLAGGLAAVQALASVPAPSPPSESPWEDILKYLNEIICPWYDNSGLLNAVTTTLTSEVANSPLNSLQQYVLINTLQLCTGSNGNPSNIWTPLQLTNLPNFPDNTSGDTLVIDAAMSTSAAPMYFPPYEHSVYGYCADGGLFANNPGCIAITSLMSCNIALEHIWMLSVSTGTTLDCYPASIINQVTPGDFGPLFWIFPASQPLQAVANEPYTPAFPLMSAFFDATSEIDARQCTQLLGSRYIRADVPLTQPIALDDSSAAAIGVMQKAVNNYTQASPPSGWAAVQSWIETNFGPNG